MVDLVWLQLQWEKTKIIEKLFILPCYKAMSSVQETYLIFWKNTFKYFTWIYLRRLFLNIQIKIMCRFCFKDVNDSFKICVMVPTISVQEWVIHVKTHSFPAGLAECILTDWTVIASSLVKSSGSWKISNFSKTQVNVVCVTEVCFIMIATRYQYKCKSGR